MLEILSLEVFELRLASLVDIGIFTQLKVSLQEEIQILLHSDSLKTFCPSLGCIGTWKRTSIEHLLIFSYLNEFLGDTQLQEALFKGIVDHLPQTGYFPDLSSKHTG